ncbi:glycosyltransferase family 2 protein [Rhizobium herbae]|uniref:Cellulose synthase/poly-beta-1,6-N-acetylglucosamine synthase-like glycosyltransferase n=1 Tax=Rhizobium herbae TaxID=508661 RepID=A0ABS4EJS6_9HYPH|nr:glycosyltransferase family 2 protein [Rhizobium herbae]MBP1858183.1 cellulose synthase/poly-beta-1,6-N-acetylglucosamine synthase-like glycosyltransferase [Rhizobium herbae]
MATANEPTARRSLSDAAARRLPPALKQEGRLLLQMGIGKPAIARAMLLADIHGTTVEEELLASGEIDETIYFEALAEKLGLDFMPDIDSGRVQDIADLDTQIARPEMLRVHHTSRPPVTVIVPSLSRLAEVAALLERTPLLRRSLAVSTPSAVRKAAWQAGRLRRVSATTRSLFETVPLHSARITFWGKQGFYAGIILCAMVAASITVPLVSLLMLHIVLTLFYLANFLVRFYALGCAFMQERAGQAPKPDVPAGPLPIYSVLVALYKEESVATQLVDALDRLDWPRSRLDIKLICEEDDAETIAALKALPLASEYEIVLVPVHLPRTKPKALSYALPGVRGTFVTVYDAEDRPHPGQLREAHAAFMAAPRHVICLQAPLIVTNARQSWLSALFALEYAGLFRGLLPMLSLTGLPLPLGGTSNHFRTAELKQIGGWDPYNMTEDADLGLRLHRLGYRSRVIFKPTFEEAPISLPVWLGQRTRWFKGWLQTWLVLMRRPAQLGREMGWPAFAVFQILIAGMLLSSLSHPVIVGFLVYLTWAMLQDGTHVDGWLAFWLFICDVVNIFGSYAVFVSLGFNRMTTREKRAVGRRWVFVPFYWLMMSLAAWRALLELRTSPFSWNKTPHAPVGKS